MAVTASPKEPAITNWNQSRFTSNSVVEKNDYRQMLSRRGEAEAGVDDPLSKRRNFDVYYGIYGPYAYYGPYGVPGRSGRGVSYRRYGVSSGRYAATPNGPGRRAAEVCSNQAPELTDWPIERIAEVVQPTDAQRLRSMNCRPQAPRPSRCSSPGAQRTCRASRPDGSRRWRAGCRSCLPPCRPCARRSSASTNRSATSRRRALIRCVRPRARRGEDVYACLVFAFRVQPVTDGRP
jgi:hypothetical protein